MKILDFNELISKVPNLNDKIGSDGVKTIKESIPSNKCLGKCEREFISETKEDKNIIFCFSCKRTMEF